jgi:hypothetical protein
MAEDVMEKDARENGASAAITPEACRENALRFSPDRFRAEFTPFVEREWGAFKSR